MRAAVHASSPRALLAAAGLAPLKRFGQNFLVDGNFREFLLRAAGLSPETLVLEIGSGVGLFTAEIARLAGRVVAVEVDRRLAPLAREVLDPFPRVTRVEADALAADRESLAPAVRAALTAALNEGFGTVRVLSNLPYQNAATIAVALLESGFPIDRMVVTVQKEVAERIAARPGDRRNGALSLLVQSLAEVRILRRVPPEVFWPRPTVESAVLEIALRSAPAVSREEIPLFKKTLEALFRHPRKTLLNSLGESAPCLGSALPQEVLQTCGVNPARRPQTLTVAEAAAILRRIPRHLA